MAVDKMLQDMMAEDIEELFTEGEEEEEEDEDTLIADLEDALAQDAAGEDEDTLEADMEAELARQAAEEADDTLEVAMQAVLAKQAVEEAEEAATFTQDDLDEAFAKNSAKQNAEERRCSRFAELSDEEGEEEEEDDDLFAELFGKDGEGEDEGEDEDDEDEAMKGVVVESTEPARKSPTLHLTQVDASRRRCYHSNFGTRHGTHQAEDRLQIVPTPPPSPLRSLALPSRVTPPTIHCPEQSQAKPKAPVSGLALPPNPRIPTITPAGQSVAPLVGSSSHTDLVPPADLPTPPQSPAKRKRTNDDQEKSAKKQKQSSVGSNDRSDISDTPQWVKQSVGLPAKRKRADDEQEQPAKKQKQSPDRFYHCRYGCKIHIKSKANMKAHAEKVHNLFLAGQSNGRCACGKMFHDQKEYEKHRERSPCSAFKIPEGWKVPPPTTLQEYADTWGLTKIYGEISAYLNVPVDDHGNAIDKLLLSSELVIPRYEVKPGGEKGLRWIELPIEPPMPAQPPASLDQTAPVEIPEEWHQAPLPPVRSFDQIMNDLDTITYGPEHRHVMPDRWLLDFAHQVEPTGETEFLRWINQADQSFDRAFQSWFQSGQSSSNPIVLN